MNAAPVQWGQPYSRRRAGSMSFASSSAWSSPSKRAATFRGRYSQLARSSRSRRRCAARKCSPTALLSRSVVGFESPSGLAWLRSSAAADMAGCLETLAYSMMARRHGASCSSVGRLGSCRRSSRRSEGARDMSDDVEGRRQRFTISRWTWLRARDKGCGRVVLNHGSSGSSATQGASLRRTRIGADRRRHLQSHGGPTPPGPCPDASELPVDAPPPTLGPSA